MTPEEKAAKFAEIQQYLWDAARSDNVALASFSAALIRHLKIAGPDGESPESA